MAEEIHILKQFKNGLITFLDELIEIFPTETDIILFRIFIKDQLPIKDVIQIFYHSVHKDNELLKNMIISRNEAFFLENNIFDSIESHVLNLKKLWISGILDVETKEIIFQWVESFIYLSSKYDKLNSATF